MKTKIYALLNGGKTNWILKYDNCSLTLYDAQMHLSNDKLVLIPHIVIEEGVFRQFKEQEIDNDFIDALAELLSIQYELCVEVESLSNFVIIERSTNKMSISVIDPTIRKRSFMDRSYDSDSVSVLFEEIYYRNINVGSIVVPFPHGDEKIFHFKINDLNGKKVVLSKTNELSGTTVRKLYDEDDCSWIEIIQPFNYMFNSGVVTFMKEVDYCACMQYCNNNECRLSSDVITDLELSYYSVEYRDIVVHHYKDDVLGKSQLEKSIAQFDFEDKDNNLVASIVFWEDKIFIHMKGFMNEFCYMEMFDIEKSSMIDCIIDHFEQILNNHHIIDATLLLVKKSLPDIWKFTIARNDNSTFTIRFDHQHSIGDEVSSSLMHTCYYKN